VKQWSKKTGVTRGEGRGAARGEGEKEAIKGRKCKLGRRHKGGKRSY